MSGSPTTPLGALIQVIGSWPPGEAAPGRAIARLIGLPVPAESSSIAAAPAPRPEAQPQVPSTPPAPPLAPPTPPGVAPAASQGAPSPISTGEWQLLKVSRAPERETAPTPVQVDPIAIDEGAGQAPLPHEPLFASVSSRALLGALASSWRADGPVDIEALIAAIATRRPIARLARVRRRTLARGLQLIVDRGDGMLPFARDVDDLLTRVRALVSGELLEVLRIDRSPLETWTASAQSEPNAYRPPPARTPVIAVSDFGIAPDERPDNVARDWLAIAQVLRRSDCRLVGIVPYPKSRWPRALARAIELVTWDRSTRLHASSRAAPGRSA